LSCTTTGTSPACWIFSRAVCSSAPITSGITTALAGPEVAGWDGDGLGDGGGDSLGVGPAVGLPLATGSPGLPLSFSEVSAHQTPSALSSTTTAATAA